MGKKDAKEESKDNRDLYEGLTGLIAESDTLLNSVSVASNKSLTNPLSPGSLKTMGFAQGGSNSSLSENRVKMMHQKLEMRRLQAEEAKKNADKSRERQLHANKQLMETMAKLKT